MTLADVKDYPLSKCSRSDIKRAGKIITADNIVINGKIDPEVQQAFLIANSWRNAHAFPMKSIRSSLSTYMRLSKLKGITAARLKRMQAIRSKLRRPKIVSGLDQLQDLGGCRAILSTIADVRLLVQILADRLPSEIQKQYPYIDQPKNDGYRSHHIVFGFRGRKITPHDGKRIELQIRTRLQHSWATAIEAVGLFRGEELKNNLGDQDWLRLFRLMSAEFAEAERCPVPLGTPEAKQRRQEIIQLESSLGSVSF